MDYYRLKYFRPDSLNPIEYELPIASAQIKSCILLAGLYLEEETIVIESKRSRNHTEQMLGLKVVEEKWIEKNLFFEQKLSNSIRIFCAF